MKELNNQGLSAMEPDIPLPVDIGGKWVQEDLFHVFSERI
jgi:hypothetical protein